MQIHKHMGSIKISTQFFEHDLKHLFKGCDEIYATESYYIEDGAEKTKSLLKNLRRYYDCWKEAVKMESKSSYYWQEQF